MSTNILILITDGKGGRLEIDGRLDLLGQFLKAVYGGDGKIKLNLTHQEESPHAHSHPNRERQDAEDDRPE